MKKTSNIKTTKLMVDDRIKVGGCMYRITCLTKNFGRGRDRVRIHAHSLDARRTFLNLEVPAKTRFTIFNKK